MVLTAGLRGAVLVVLVAVLVWVMVFVRTVVLAGVG